MATGDTKPFRGFTGRNDTYNNRGLSPTEQVLISVDPAIVEAERQSRYAQNWQTYLSVHLNERVAIGSGQEEGQTEAKINYVRTMIDAMSSFAFGKPFKMTPDHDAEEGMRDKIELMIKYVERVWSKRNNGDANRLELAQFCAVCGDAMVAVLPVMPESLTVQIAGSNFEVDKKNYKLRVLVLQPANVKPFYTPDKRLVRADLTYPVMVPSDLFGNMEYAIMQQTITPTKIVEKIINRDGGIVSEKTLDNPIGRVYVVHWKNGPSPTMFGMDDVSPLRGSNQEYNDKLSNMSDIIDYHAAPTTVIFGARAGNMEKGASKVWSGFPANAKVENLKLEGDLTAAANFLKELKSNMKELSGVGDAALGGDLAISNTSGVALLMRFYSMLSKAYVKWSQWGPAVQEIAQVILLWGRWLKQIEFDDADLEAFMDSVCVAFQVNLPEDTLLKIQMLSTAVEKGLKQREKALSELGEGNPDSVMNGIEDELKKFPLYAGMISNGLIIDGKIEGKQNVDNGTGSATNTSAGANKSTVLPK